MSATRRLGASPSAVAQPPVLSGTGFRDLHKAVQMFHLSQTRRITGPGDRLHDRLFSSEATGKCTLLILYVYPITKALSRNSYMYM